MLNFCSKQRELPRASQHSAEQLTLTERRPWIMVWIRYRHSVLWIIFTFIRRLACLRTAFQLFWQAWYASLYFYKIVNIFLWVFLLTQLKQYYPFHGQPRRTKKLWGTPESFRNYANKKKLWRKKNLNEEGGEKTWGNKHCACWGTWKDHCKWKTTRSEEGGRE